MRALLIAFLAAAVLMLSGQANAQQSAQTITFPQLANMTIGSTPPSPDATSTSGLVVTYTSDTTSVCTVTSRGVITVVDSGLCTIRAQQAGNVSYSAAAEVTQSFTISKVTQTITFSQPADTAFTAQPPILTATASSALPVTYTSATPATCSVTSAGTITFNSPGQCTITAAQVGNANYASASLNRTFVILDTQVITFQQPANTLISDPPPVLNVTSSSTQPITFASNSTTVCTVTSSGTLTLLTGGTCSITASQAATSVYAAASVTRTFSVLGTANVITFPALADTPFTSTPPILGATASSNLPVSYASTTTSVCRVNSGVLLFVAIGTCSITASQLGDQTHAAATPVSNSFNVTLVPNVITFTQPVDVVFGDPAPTLQASASSGLPVTFISNSTSVCTTTSAGVVTILSTGSCEIVASQSGNLIYSSATSVTRTFNVGIAGSSINFTQPPDTPFTSSPPRLNAASSTNQAVTFSSTTPACSVTPQGDLTFISVGACTITAAVAANANVSSAQVTRTFSITQGVNVITFPALPSTSFTSTPPTLAAVASSTLPVAYVTNSPGVCSVSGGSISFVASGQCSITASQPGDANYASASPVTRVFNVTTSANVITFPQPADTPFTSAPPVPAATASSNLPVTYLSNSNGVCTVTASGSITFVSGGNCTITAYQSGNGSWRAAQPVTRTFVVQVGNNIITFAQPADTPFTSNPPALSANASSGLAVTFTSQTTSVCTVTTGGEITFVSGGVCSITAGQAGNGTYTAATPVTRSFTVTPGVNVITFAQPADRILSAAPPILGATASSGLIVSYVSNSPAVCSVTPSGTVQLLSPGNCAITASQTGNVSYAAAISVQQVFTINQNPTSSVVTQFLNTLGILPNTRSSTRLAASSVVPLMGQPVVLTATIEPTPDAGTVNFLDGTTTICSSIALSGAVATCTVRFETGGAHNVTAAYSGSVNFAGSVSDILVINVTDQRGRTAQTIATFMSRRSDLIMSNGPNESREVDRLLEAEQNGGASNPSTTSGFAPGLGSAGGSARLSDEDRDAATMAFGGRNVFQTPESPGSAGTVGASMIARGLHFDGSLDGAQRYSFTTSLRDIVRSNAAQDQQKASAGGFNLSGGQSGFANSRAHPFDIWVDARYASFRDPTFASNVDGHFGLVSVGADYVLSPGLLVGVMGQYDSMSERSDTKQTEVKGSGWMVGPYATVRLASNVFWQVRGAWGQSDNDVRPYLTYTDSFATSRWLVTSTLTGHWTNGAWTFRPTAAVSYMEETSEAYTDTFGTSIPSVIARLGQAKIGPEVGYTYQISPNMTVEPHLALQMIWNFANDATMAGFGAINSEPVGSSTIRGRAELGLRAKTARGLALGVSGSYDGIGTNGFNAVSGKAALEVPLN